MAIIVEHKATGQRAVLLGSGFGAYAATRPSYWWGNIDPHKENGVISTVAICGQDGAIRWVQTEEVVVVEIDGQPVSNFDVAHELGTQNIKTTCERCKRPLDIGDNLCKNCGLRN